MVHDFTVLPSSTTVQAPQWLVSQPTCVPVSPSTSRMKWTSNSRGSTSACRSRPFTLTRTNCFLAIRSPLNLSLFACPFCGAGKSASRQLLYQALFVFRRATQVRTRLSFISCQLASLPDGCFIELLTAQERFRLACLHRCRPYVGQSNAGLLARPVGVQSHLSRYGGGSKVADLALQFEVGASTSRRWQGDTNLGHDFIRLQRCGEN